MTVLEPIPEIVDIVDDQNVVQYQCAKDEAHQKGLLHRCVVAELITPDGNMVLVKQAGDRQDAGQYVSPVGGHVQAGESVEDALTREAGEELGIATFTKKFVGKAIYNREVIGRKENHYFFLYELHTDEPITLNHESVGYESFTVDQLKTELKDNPTKFGDAYWFVVRSFYPELLS